jgi:hypothetical protein
VRLQRQAEARPHWERVAAAVKHLTHPRMVGMAHGELGRIALYLGEPNAAREHLAASLQLLPDDQPVKAGTWNLQAAICLLDGHPARALEPLEGALRQRASGHGYAGHHDEWVDLLYPRVLAAVGRGDEARAALLAAKSRLLGLAAKLPDDEARQLLLSGPVHARIVELAGRHDAIRRLLDLPLF